MNKLSRILSNSIVDWGQFEFKPDRPLVPALVTHAEYHHPISAGFNFDGAARLFTVPGSS